MYKGPYWAEEEYTGKRWFNTRKSAVKHHTIFARLRNGFTCQPRRLFSQAL